MMKRDWAWIWLACAQQGSAAGLQEAIDAARGFDTSISAAFHTLQAGLEKRKQGVAALLPRAQVDGNYLRQDQPGAAYSATVRRHGANVSVTQPLFDLARFADYQRGNALSEQAVITFAIALQDLTLGVAGAYFDVLYQREVLQAAGAAQLAYQRQLDQSRDALKLGEGTRTELDEAQANLDQAAANVLSAQTDLEIAEGRYRRLTSLDAADISPLAHACVPGPFPAALQHVMDEAAGQNLDVRLAERRVEHARSGVTAARGTSLPVVSLQGSYGANWSRSSDQDALGNPFVATSKTRSSTIGVTVTIPLFAGGAHLSSAREAYSLRASAADALLDAQRKARESAREAYLGFTNGSALVRAQERALASAQGKVASTRLGREVGLRTSIDELNAQQRYFEAIRDLAAARYKMLRARLQLAAALGALGDSDVAAVTCQAGGAA